MERYALLSVSDRENIEVFAKGLVERGFTLLTTSGTGKYLNEHGIPSTAIGEFTKQPEILGGRVKTLHPKIHGGILANRSEEGHLADLKEHSISPIDVVAVNLYPFEEQKKSNPNASLQEMVEFIDIGGPTMIRAAAKNAKDVYAVIDPVDYTKVLEALDKEEDSNGTVQLRQALSSKVFTQLAHYNLEIAKYLSATDATEYPLTAGGVWSRSQALRYGENPQQSAALYESNSAGEKTWKQLAGKELSYNNILDADAGYRLIRTLYSQKARFSKGEIVCIMKHLTPCGVAVSDDQVSALKNAKLSDPRSHFGGILCFSSQLTGACAEEIIKDFSEIIIAPSFSSEALQVFEKRKNVRLIEANYESEMGQEVRSTLFGSLVQAPDLVNCSLEQCEKVAGDEPSDEIKRDLELAWNVVTHTKSNAIVLVKDQMLIGGGAGQTSRIDAVEVALYKAKTHSHVTSGAVAASDAFFPFPDSVERLAAEGVKAIVTPGGSKKDPEVIEVANKLGVSLYFAPERHFRH